MEVHKIVQTKDDKQYQIGIMKLKQEYVDSVVGSRSIAKQKDQETVKVLAQTFGSSE
jgi:hypothetical protein